MPNTTRSAVALSSLCLMIASLVGYADASAESASDTFTATVASVLTPGLPATGCAVQSHITFDSISFAVAGDDTQTGAIHLDLASAGCENASVGFGAGTVSGTMAGNVSYERTGMTYSFSGAVLLNGEWHNIATFICQMSPTSSNPTTTMAGSCHGTLDS